MSAPTNRNDNARLTAALVFLSAVLEDAFPILDDLAATFGEATDGALLATATAAAITAQSKLSAIRARLDRISSEIAEARKARAAAALRRDWEGCAEPVDARAVARSTA
jgi:hypothetical protein